MSARGNICALLCASGSQVVSKELPYLNSVLGGVEYVKSPASVTFKNQGKLITVYDNKIAFNALKDEKETEKIIEWLNRKISDAWNKKDEITPCYKCRR
ncbi:MAG: hypothetical protein JRG81_09540 [Deltaproteobacteria bacterium]|nr:hypothetical protein [Deltaproteobacteria bacterium]